MTKILLAALLLLIIGGGVAAFIYSERRFDWQWQAHLTLVAALTILTAGTTAICALAPWWVHR